jgi:hypothetical protein
LGNKHCRTTAIIAVFARRFRDLSPQRLQVNDVFQLRFAKSRRPGRARLGHIDTCPHRPVPDKLSIDAGKARYLGDKIASRACNRLELLRDRSRGLQRGKDCRDAAESKLGRARASRPQENRAPDIRNGAAARAWHCPASGNQMARRMFWKVASSSSSAQNSEQYSLPDDERHAWRSFSFCLKGCPQ